VICNLNCLSDVALNSATQKSTFRQSLPPFSSNLSELKLANNNEQNNPNASGHITLHMTADSPYFDENRRDLVKLHRKKKDRTLTPQQTAEKRLSVLQ